MAINALTRSRNQTTDNPLDLSSQTEFRHPRDPQPRHQGVLLMYAMQYQIILPTDYDMQIIRDRVAKTGHLMDGYHGLEFKSYLIQEKAKGAPQNAYAPFYVWRNIDGMRQFCWGQLGYAAIVRDFGRHPIQDWTIHQLVNKSTDYSTARSLTVAKFPLPTSTAPSDCVDAVTADFLATATDSTIARVTAVDVSTWNIILVELSSQEADQSSTDVITYEVLHTSAAALSSSRPTDKSL